MFPHSIDPAIRAQIVTALQKSYERFAPAQFERDGKGGYPALGAGASQSILGWIYPAMHLTLEPRRGREAADRALARKMIVRAILQGQYRVEGDPADGVWRINLSDGDNSYPRDRNMAGFMGCGLVRIWACDPLKLNDWPDEDLTLFKDAVRRSAEAGLRHWVRVGYTNPQCLDFYLSWAAAELLNDPSHREHARKHLENFLAYARTTDSFEEWSSPTYLAVNLTGLVPLAHFTKGSADERTFAELLNFQWKLIGAAVHAPTMEICGPHSRAYGDTAGEKADHAYAWLHLAAPEVFRADPERLAEMYEGLAAPGLYVPLGIPAEVKTCFGERFETPAESRENFEWIGRTEWQPPYRLLTRPAPPAPRVRLGTRYRAAKFCLGSCNELDLWSQRRPCLAYWNDGKGRRTGLKFYAVIDAGDAAKEFLGDWLFMEAFEFISAQSNAHVIGAFRTATVAPAKPGDTLGAPARSMSVGREKMFDPKNPVGWFLGTHWRQAIEPAWRRQRIASVWLGVTPIGKGAWTRLDTDGTRWAFSENGIEALLETPNRATTSLRANLTRSNERVECLEFWSAANLEWDWLNLPEFFAPFAFCVQDTGAPRSFGLTVRGNSAAFELSHDELRLKWSAPAAPNCIQDRTWWAWAGGREILPPGYER